MAAKKPTLGYPSRTACCLALHDQGKSYHEIAILTGIEPTTVSALLTSGSRARQARACEQNGRTIVFATDLLDMLAPHAIKRKITVNALARRLVEIAVEEGMVDAILDDDHETGKAAA